MTLFFLVVGLEARREFDLGDLRERRRFVLPFAAGLVGMADPGGDLPGRQRRARQRARLGRRDVHRHRARPRAARAARPQRPRPGAGLPADRVRRRRPRRAAGDRRRLQRADRHGPLLHRRSRSSRCCSWPPCSACGSGTVYAGLGLVIWAALLASGVDPVVAGLAIGLSATAYTPTRGDLEQATGLVRRFREQPTPELARTATVGPDLRRCRRTNGCRASTTRGRAT